MKNDQIFTPPYIVDYMLDLIEYYGDNIIGKTILEPSFGDGAFLTAIVERNLEYAEKHRLTRAETLHMLDNVYGIEVDQKYYKLTIEKLNKQISKHGLSYDWPNLICGNTLNYTTPVQFDFAALNPPYIRIHDLDMETRANIEANFKFGTGNTDLYVIFFEKCMKMMNEKGRMCFITPNSYFKNTSQKSFRQWLANTNVVKTIIDYGNINVFEKISTYTAITIIDFAKETADTEYTLMCDKAKKEYTTYVNLQTFKQMPWSFASEDETKFLQSIKDRPTKLKDLCDIQYGLATNADKIYILDSKTASNLEPGILRPVVKGSTLAVDKQIIFPYEFDEKAQKYILVDEETLQKAYPKVYNHLFESKAILDVRDMEQGAAWYQYGRSQGIQNSRHPKIILKHIVSNDDTNCEITLADENTLVYSGMFIVVKNENDYLRVMRAVTSDEFCKYIKIVGKNMSGGYKSFNTAAVKNFGIKEKEEKNK